MVLWTSIWYSYVLHLFIYVLHLFTFQGSKNFSRAINFYFGYRVISTGLIQNYDINYIYFSKIIEIPWWLSIWVMYSWLTAIATMFIAWLFAWAADDWNCGKCSCFAYRYLLEHHISGHACYHSFQILLEQSLP